jgi:PhnB protein
MTSIQPELWVERAGQAIAFYGEAFGARVLHRVGEGDDIVAQLAVGEAAFWVAAAGPDMGRFSPHAMGGATSRTLLVADDPDTVLRRAIDAGATEKSRYAMSTAGVSAGSSIRLGTSGRSASRSGPGRRPEIAG